MGGTGFEDMKDLWRMVLAWHNERAGEGIYVDTGSDSVQPPKLKGLQRAAVTLGTMKGHKRPLVKVQTQVHLKPQSTEILRLLDNH